MVYAYVLEGVEDDARRAGLSVNETREQFARVLSDPAGAPDKPSASKVDEQMQAQAKLMAGFGKARG